MTLARIFLILSVVNFTLADLAKSRAMLDAHADWMKMAGDMSKASEKWHKPLDELSEPSAKWSTAMHAHSESMDASSDDSVTGPKADTPPDSATDDGKKFLNEEWKEETKEDMVSAVISTAVTTLASEFVDEITGPADPGSCVFFPIASLFCQHFNGLSDKTILTDGISQFHCWQRSHHSRIRCVSNPE
jgi:hypothetical protein